MLSTSRYQELKICGQYPKKMNDITFFSKRPLWIKESKHPTIQAKNIPCQHFKFFKIGKILGIEAIRYLRYYDNHLFYYQGIHDSFKGYCFINNLYYQAYPCKDNRIVVILSNGANSCEMFFIKSEFEQFLVFAKKHFFNKLISLNYQSRYKVIDLVGQGSFSKVFAVEEKGSERKVVAKVINKKDKHKQSTKSIVIQEKLILENISNPYVYKFYEFSEDEQSYVFFLEYLEGKDLMTIFREKTEILVKDVIILFRHILLALDMCHKNNIIHRDLKPQNIIVNMTNFSPTIIDFGLSLLVTPYTPLKSYKRCGTMGYMAPEVLANSAQEKHVYTQKCDIFSFGIIAHMILLGFNPLKGANYDETFTKNRKCEINLCQDTIESSFGPGCYQFLKGLLQKNPQERYSAEQALKNQFLCMNTDKVKEVAYQKSLNSAEFSAEASQNSVPNDEANVNPISQISIKKQKF